LIIYPVVSSFGKDNTGGFSHLRGNIEVYKHLGFKVICLCRFHPRLFYIKDGVYFFNLIPGRARPTASECETIGKNIKDDRDLFRKFLMTIRGLFSHSILGLLIYCLRPALVHQRANSRVMAYRGLGHAKYLLELNDEFESKGYRDAYLSITPRKHIKCPSLINSWPVVSYNEIDEEFIKKKFREIPLKKSLQIVLYGVGGIDNIDEVLDFISGHVWVRSKKFKLYIYGALGKSKRNIKFMGFEDDVNSCLQRYDLGLIFYSKEKYPDTRIRQGDPSKFYKYVDSCLPIISNREHISNFYLNNMDQSSSVFKNNKLLEEGIQFMKTRRESASVEFYAQRLKELLNQIDCPY